MNEKKCLTCGIEVTDTCPLDQGEPPCEPKRDLNEDLAICNAATQGPWVYSEGLYVVKNVTGDSFEWDADFVAEAGAEEDAAFTAAAREGWPHAIRRAQAAEAEVDRLREFLRKVSRELWWGNADTACDRVSSMIRKELADD